MTIVMMNQFSARITSMEPRNQFASSKNSTTLMAAEFSPDQVDEFMKTSFYLPVDVLKDDRWQVLRAAVITGKEFQLARTLHMNGTTLHCLESVTLLDQARYVGVQERWNKKEQRMYMVAKIWYGRLPVGGLS